MSHVHFTRQYLRRLLELLIDDAPTVATCPRETQVCQCFRESARTAINAISSRRFHIGPCKRWLSCLRTCLWVSKRRFLLSKARTFKHVEYLGEGREAKVGVLAGDTRNGWAMRGMVICATVRAMRMATTSNTTSDWGYFSVPLEVVVLNCSDETEN